MSAMQLILVRHAETAWNRDNKFLGATDVPLTDEGARQAGLAASAVAKLKPDCLISSPLLRARMTADAIAEKAALIPSTMDELTEIDMGDLEGLEGRDMREQYPELLDQWRRDPSRVCFPAGECMTGLRTRITSAIRSFERSYDGKTLAVVSHNFPIKIALLAYLGLPLSQFPPAQRRLGLHLRRLHRVRRPAGGQAERHLPHRLIGGKPLACALSGGESQSSPS